MDNDQNVYFVSWRQEIKLFRNVVVDHRVIQRVLSQSVAPLNVFLIADYIYLQYVAIILNQSRPDAHGRLFST